MSLSPDKKIVLITGCSPGGIGHSLALEFHSRGLHVIATARNRTVLSDLEEMGMTTLSLEVTDEEMVREAVREVGKVTGGRLDILVNNAGVNYTVPAVEVDMASVRQLFDVNFHSVVHITQTFLPLLLPTKGLIVNIGSVAALIPYTFSSMYNASKAALHAYSSTLRLELAPYDISVMVVVTGGVKSNIARTDRELKEDSLYIEIESDYKRRLKHSQEVGADNMKYAKEVVREALRAKPRKWVWKGRMALVIWFALNFGGGWLFDLVLPRMFGLTRLRKILRAAKT